jgi:hypothetical protein
MTWNGMKTEPLETLILALRGAELELSLAEPDEGTHDEDGNPLVPVAELVEDIRELQAEIKRRITN